MNELEPLSPDVASLLRRERSRTSASPDRVEALLARVERNAALVAATAVVGSVGAAAVVAAEGRWGLLRKLLGAWSGSKAAVAVAVFAVGGVTGGVVTHSVVDRAPAVVVAPSPSSSSSGRAGHSTTASASPSSLESSDAAPGALSSGSAEPTLQALPSAAASAVNGSGAPLETERTWVDRGRSALGKGDTEGALRALAEHEKRFPNGASAEERDALVVKSLVASGRKDDATRKLESFERRYPNSLFTTGLRRALGL